MEIDGRHTIKNKHKIFKKHARVRRMDVREKQLLINQYVYSYIVYIYQKPKSSVVQVGETRPRASKAVKSIKVREDPSSSVEKNKSPTSQVCKNDATYLRMVASKAAFLNMYFASVSLRIIMQH